MDYWFAPMEGLTDGIFRRLHRQYFGGVGRYYMPFLSPTAHRSLTRREEEVLPMAVGGEVPQLLTRVPEDFLWAARQCRDRGYDEVNLNLGCPSGTVCAKGKGAGMLCKSDELDAFLDTVCAAAPLDISVKARIGYADPEEFPRLLEIFNRYPLKVVILHPRLRSQFYSGSVHLEAFRLAYRESKNPLCYNGDLKSTADIQLLRQEFPALEQVMLGRGLLRSPGMLCPQGTQRETLEAFTDELFAAYRQRMGGRNAMFRIKEHWSYLIDLFDGSEKLGKALRKTTDVAEFCRITRQVFATLPMKKA